jgi:hypothetical protein
MRHALTGSVLAGGVVLALSGTADAQGFTRYVSSGGSDANPCTRALPCRTLQAGIDITPIGGEVQVLDSGDYGSNVSIGKSITVSAVGVSAALSGTLKINGTTNTTVVIRGLHLNGHGIVNRGIEILRSKVVSIEDCVVERYAGHGIDAGRAFDQFNIFASRLSVLRTVSRNNGINGLSFSWAPFLTIADSHFDNNGGHGVSASLGNVTMVRSTASQNAGTGVVYRGATIDVSQSIAANNGGAGFAVFDAFSCDVCYSTGRMTLIDTTARGNAAAGLVVCASELGPPDCVGRLSNSVITENGIGIQNLGVVETRGNNTVTGNGVNLTGDPPIPLPPT